MLCFSEFVFEIGQNGPFRQAIRISSICNKVFRTKFQKPDSVGVIPRGGYRMGDRKSVEPLQWLAYIGRTLNNVTHAGNGREVHLAGVSNVKVDGYCQETNEVFQHFACFSHGCLFMTNRHKPIGNTDEALQKRYEKIQARLQKIENAGYIVISNWGCEFRKLLRKNPGLENELSSHPYVKISPINILGWNRNFPDILQIQRGGEDPLCGRYMSVPLDL